MAFQLEMTAKNAVRAVAVAADLGVNVLMRFKGI